MFASMYERLENIAQEDFEREKRLGFRCPIRLDLWLTGGAELWNVELVDSLNSLDDETIDVARACAPGEQPSASTYTVAIAHIAVVKHTWPSADEEAAASRKAAA